MKRRAWAVAAAAWVAFDVPAQGSPAPEPPPRTLFDTRLMRHGGPIDVSRFERGEALAPGVHELDVVRNGEPMGRHRVRFAMPDAGGFPTPCIDASLAAAIELALPMVERAGCVGIAFLVPGARVEYVAESLALHVTVPQAALAHRARDAIDPALRDAGMPAFRINHAFNGLHDERRHDRGTRASIRLELGANAARWRWRHRATHAWATGGDVHGNTLSSTLERDLDAFDAQLTLGDFHTSGVLFDTIGLRGIRMASDDRMLPPSMLRYAPVVRGVANTNARVQVRQGGVLLHDTTVAPGPFALRDVQPLGLGGALEVRVVEADGRVSTFSVPHAAVPGLLRAGQSRFSLAAGRWRGSVDAFDAARDVVFQGTVQRGVQDRLSLQAGAQLAPGYTQALGGVAVSTRAGAFSIDRAQSHWANGLATVRGHALRAAYAGRVGTGATVDVAAWRVGTDGFRSLGEVMRQPANVRERARTDATLRQALGRRGALTLGVVDRTWRGPLARQRSLRIGWGAALRGAGLLQASLDQSIAGAVRTTTGTISLSLPLAFGTGPSLLHAHARTIDDQTTLHASASGTLGRDRRHGWSSGVSHAQASNASTTTTSATFSTQGRAGRVRAGLSASPATRQWSATAEGSLVLHPHGATFGMPLGDTVALVRAPHGQGATLLQQPTVRLDRAGRAVVPELSPYRRNTVGVDPGTASRDVQFDWTERSVVPRAGAVLDVPLPTLVAPLHRLRIVRANGHPAPFAADVRDDNDVSLGTVGRDGVVLLRAPDHLPHVDLHWYEDGHPRRCRITLPPQTGDASCTE